MGVLKNLLGLGVAAGAAFAAVKVARKYDENRAADEAALFGSDAAPEDAQEEIPEDAVFLDEEQEAEAAGTLDEEEFDGEEPAGEEEEAEESRFVTVMRDLGRAAGDVLMDAGAALKSAAEKAGVDTEELRGALHDAGSAVAHAGGAVADYVKQEAPAVVEQVREGAKEVIAQVKDSISITIERDDAEEAEDEENEGKWVEFETPVDAAEAEKAAAEADRAAAEADRAAAEADRIAAEEEAAGTEEEDDRL